MIKFENEDIWGFEHAIRGMRNPLNSWGKSDSSFDGNSEGVFSIGDNDLTLMKKLANAGPEHRKYLRQMFVSVDITAPLYWWKEFDTYKVGTTANSCSTMHTIMNKEFGLDDFSSEHMTSSAICELDRIIEVLNVYRELYLNYDENKESDYPRKEYWYSVIQLLPSSYNQKRTITMSYENMFNMFSQRYNHKLDEWRDFCNWVYSFPCFEQLLEKTMKKIATPVSNSNNEEKKHE